MTLGRESLERERERERDQMEQPDKNEYEGQ